MRKTNKAAPQDSSLGTPKQRTLHELRAVEDVLGMTYDAANLPRIKKVPSPAEVAEVLCRVRDSWVDAEATMATTQASIDGVGAALVWDGPLPGRVAADLPKIALYAENLLVLDPLAVLAFHEGPESAKYRPEAWTGQVVTGALYLGMLRNWIAADYVSLIVPPSSYSANIRDRIWQLWRNRDKVQETTRALLESHGDEVIADILQDFDRETRDFALQQLAKSDPDMYRKVTARLGADDGEPAWLVDNLPPGLSMDIAMTGTGLAPLELRHILSRWDTYVSSGRSPLLVAQALRRNPSAPSAIDYAVRSLPLEFPIDVPWDVLYRLRQEGRLEALRTRLRQEYEAFMSRAAGSADEQVGELATHVQQIVKDYGDEWETTKQEIIQGATGLAGAGAAVGSFAIGQLSLGTTVVAGMSLLSTGDKLAKIPQLPRQARKGLTLRRNPLFVLHRLSRMRPQS